MAIQIRRGTDSEWESNKSNIVAGEPAVAMDSERMFVGTGNGTYMELANIDVLANPFDSSASYVVGDFTAYHGKLYKCNTDHSGAWNASHFDEVALADALDALGDGVYTKAEADALLALKADKSDTYTKTETYTKAQVDSIVEDAIAEAVKESEYSNFEMKSVSGDFIHITDGAGLIPVKDLKIGIEAVQEGSGDPSPENVRPITGWTGAKVNVNGVNQWDEEWEVGLFDTATGGNVQNTSQIRAKNKIPVIPNTTYFIKSYPAVWIIFYDANQNVITSGLPNGNQASNNSRLFGYISTDLRGVTLLPVPNNCHYIRFYCQNTYGTTYNHDISINYPSSDTDYHAYEGHTYEVTWQTEAGTVYGGTLDVTTGELVVDKAEADFGDLTWYYSSSTFRASINGAKLEQKGYGISTTFKHSSATYASSLQNGEFIYGIGSVDAGKLAIIVRDDSYSDASTFKTDMAGQKLVYELITPQTYQLTPTEVLTLLGENNIFADTGAVEELIYRISRQ